MLGWDNTDYVSTPEDYQKVREENQAILVKAIHVQEQAVTLAKKFSKHSDTHVFLTNLAKYLETKAINSNDYDQIRKRTLFIEDCLKKIRELKTMACQTSEKAISDYIVGIKEKMTALMNSLAHSNIKQFKGLIGNQMYSILHIYHNAFKRHQMLSTALPLFTQVNSPPKQSVKPLAKRPPCGNPLIEMIEEYDECSDFIDLQEQEEVTIKLS